jgi:O-antigen/teichoic acid export membrane protein
MPFLLLGTLAMAIFTTCNMGLIALQRYRQMSFGTLITSGLTFVAGVFWLRNGGGAEGLLAVTAIGNLVSAGVSLGLVSRTLPVWSRPAIDRDLITAMGRYALAGTALLLLMQVVYERAEIFFLSRTQPPEQVGFYSLAVAMTNIVILSIPNVVIGPLLAMSAELHSRGDWSGLRQLYSAATRLLTLIAPPVGIGAAIVAQPLIGLMYGEPYAPVALAAMLMVPPAAILMVAKPATSVMWGIGKQNRMLLALVPGAALNLTLDAWLIPVHGLLGAVVASSVAQAATTALTTYLCLRYLRFVFPWSQLARATGAALLMVPVALAAGAWLSGPLLLVAQVALGALVYGSALVAFRMIDAENARLLTGLQRRLPAPLQPPLSALLTLIARGA